MQRTVLTFGMISGLIILILGYATRPIWMDADGKMDMSTGELLGYINMIIALSMIFFGIRQFRDRHLEGKITFGKAFKVGFLISLVASVIYMVGWMIYYNTSEMAQSFPAQYMAYMKEQWLASGMTPEQISEKAAGYEKNMKLYNNPVIMAGMTLVEILPVGLLVSLISAFILKKK
jgi:Protein of unknown function (DUF4199)